MISNLYWHYPEFIRKLVNRIIKPRPTWELHCSRTSAGDWVFNYPPFIWSEVIGDTGPAIDAHLTRLTGKKPETGDTVKLVVSTEQLPNLTTVLTYQCDDGTGGSYWKDNILHEPLWLCGLLRVLYGDPLPDTLYAEFST